MNDRVIVRFLLLAVIAVVAVAFVGGCGLVLSGPKYDYASRADPKVTRDERQTEWQKMKKCRSAHVDWIESALTPGPKKPVVVGKGMETQPSRILTLSEQQLVSLDWHSPNRTGARVKGKRVVAGPGVEFDIHFSSNSPGSRSLDFVSTGEGGQGTLVGADIRDYDAFALKLTLVSINGQSEPAPKQKLVAGALIGPTSKGQLCSYEPVTLSLAASEKTMVSQIPVSTGKIYQIGFHVHMLNPQDWDRSGSMVTLRVEPVEDGVAVPKPDSRPRRPISIRYVVGFGGVSPRPRR
jgi:hypothetical protein